MPKTVLPYMAISIRRQKLVEKAKYSQNGDFLQSKNYRQVNLDWNKIGGKYQRKIKKLRIVIENEHHRHQYLLEKNI